MKSMSVHNSATLDALRDRLSGRPSKALTLTVASEAVADGAVLDSLFRCVYKGDERLRWRAAWVLVKVSEQAPSLLAAEHAALVQLAMQPDISEGLRRLLLGICYNMPSEGELDVAFFNFLIEAMVSLQSPPGVQSLAMKLAARMSRADADLHKEFCCIVQNMEMVYYSAGVRSVARHCLKQKKKK